MLKVRVQGPPGEVREFGDALERAGLVLGRSKQYADRGAPQRVREYLDIEATGTRRAEGGGRDVERT